MDCIGFKIATAPTVEPVSVVEIKNYLRLDESAYDAELLPSLITGARQYIERITGRHLASQVVEARYASFDDPLILPTTPVQSIVSISYKVAGVTATLDTAAVALIYELWDQGVFPKLVQVYGSTLPGADEDTVLVDYNSGAATDKVGVAIVKALVADLFEHPEATVEVQATENKTIERAIEAYRTGW